MEARTVKDDCFNHERGDADLFRGSSGGFELVVYQREPGITSRRAAGFQNGFYESIFFPVGNYDFAGWLR
jgi:hypothetical protein